MVLVKQARTPGELPCMAPVKHCAASDMTARPKPAAEAGSIFIVLRDRGQGSLINQR